MNFKIVLSLVLGLFFCCQSLIAQVNPNPIIVSTNSVSALVSAINQTNNNGFTTNTIQLPANAVFVLTQVWGNFFYNNVEFGSIGLPPVRLDKKLTIQGNGATIRRLETAPNFRLLAMQNNTELIINNLTLENGLTDYYGGAILLGFRSTLEVNNCTFRNNQALLGVGERGGGAIMTRSMGTVKIKDSFFDSNFAMTRGGALGILLSDLSVSNSTFVNNKTGLSGVENVGGAVYVDGGKGNDGFANIDRCVFDGNEAGDVAGGVYIFLYNNNKSLVDKCIFRNNKVIHNNGRGGGFWFASGTLINEDPRNPYTNIPNTSELTLSNSSIYNNINTTSGGGAFFAYNPEKNTAGTGFAKLINCTFAMNRVDEGVGGRGYGGAIFNFNLPMQITNCTFSQNFARTSGGAIWGSESQIININNSIFANNIANNNGSGANDRQNCYKAYRGSNNIEFPTPKFNDPEDTPCVAGSIYQDPRLGVFQDNGGWGPTYAIAHNSPAINAGTTTGVLPYDQRGVLRTDRVDIGAYEYKVECCTQTTRFEAETNYSIITDAPTNIIGLATGTDQSGGRSVRLANVGDVIRITFQAPEAGAYLLRARVRSGHNSNPAAFFTGSYGFRLNGTDVNLVGNTATIAGSSTTGIFWGTMEAPVTLNAGMNTLNITILRSWAFADYVEIGRFTNAIPDIISPTAPTLSIVNKTSSSVSLRWTKSQDNVGVIGYKLFMDEDLLTTISDTSFVVNNLAENSRHSFRVQALDAVENYSALSNRLEVRTNPVVLNAIYEAETNYIIINDVTGQSVRVQSNTNLSGGAYLLTPDVGDKIRISFPIDVAGQYRLSVRVRSGNSTNQTVFWNNGYIFTVNGNPTSFNGVGSSISGLISILSGAYFSMMESGVLNFNSGNHYIDIENTRAWAAVDYLLVTYIPPTTSALQTPRLKLEEAQDASESAEILGVFPNPTANNRIYVNLSGYVRGKIQYQIFDSFGKVVDTGNQDLQYAQNQVVIDFKPDKMPSNLYFVQLKGESILPKTVKVIKQN
ncbi:MAG: hypothetical protein MUE85_16730 [Microscillaceae bacterium]|nr:hypothetical protein [Microscillaceae bacterium]